MARVLMRKVMPLEMVFEDGTTKEALFNKEAFIIYTEEFGRLDSQTLKELSNKPYDLTARFLYCGMKVLDKEITLDEAKSLIYMGGEDLAIEVTNCIIDNFLATADEDSKKKFMQEVEKFNKALMG